MDGLNHRRRQEVVRQLILFMIVKGYVCREAFRGMRLCEANTSTHRVNESL